MSLGEKMSLFLGESLWVKSIVKSMCKKSFWVVQEEFLGEEPVGEKCMGEKYVQEEFLAEESLGEKSVQEEFLGVCG